MPVDLIQLVPALFQVGLLAVLLVFSVRMIRPGDRSQTPVFLAFWLALQLLIGLYWIIYDFMCPERRMPFAANEIAEAALLLMQAATLTAAMGRRPSFAPGPCLGALAFAACNAALWIAWSGEWMQDILVGTTYAWLLYTIACSMKGCDVLTRREWIGLGIGCALLVAGQAMTFFVPAEPRTALDRACSLLLLAGMILWTWKLLAAWRRRAPGQRLVCLACALFAWTVTALYMSEGAWYGFFLFAESLPLVFVVLAVGRGVAEA